MLLCLHGFFYMFLNKETILIYCLVIILCFWLLYVTLKENNILRTTRQNSKLPSSDGSLQIVGAGSLLMQYVCT